MKAAQYYLWLGTHTYLLSEWNIYRDNFIISVVAISGGKENNDDIIISQVSLKWVNPNNLHQGKFLI